MKLNKVWIKKQINIIIIINNLSKEGIMKKYREPEFPISPGDVLKAELNRRNISSNEFALITGWDVQKVNDILRGAIPVDSSIAEILAEKLNGNINFWINLEKKFQEELNNF